MKYVASITIVEQVTQDRWEPFEYLKEINSGTRIGEIIDWVIVKCHPNKSGIPADFVVPKITIKSIE